MKCFTKSYLTIVCLLMVTTLFIGCMSVEENNFESSVPNGNIVSTSDYRIDSFQNQLYINFVDGNDLQEIDSDIISAPLAIGFSSAVEMKNCFLNGMLSKNDAIILKKYFPKTEKGIEICNLYELYELQLSNEWVCEEFLLCSDLTYCVKYGIPNEKGFIGVLFSENRVDIEEFLHHSSFPHNKHTVQTVEKDHSQIDVIIPMEQVNDGESTFWLRGVIQNMFFCGQMKLDADADPFEVIDVMMFSLVE